MQINDLRITSEGTLSPSSTQTILAACLSLVVCLGSVGFDKFNLHDGHLGIFQFQFVPIALMLAVAFLNPKSVIWRDQNNIRLIVSFVVLSAVFIGLYSDTLGLKMWRYVGASLLFLAGSAILRSRSALVVFCKVYLLFSGFILFSQLMRIVSPEEFSDLFLKIAGPFTTARVGGVAAFLVLIAADTDKKHMGYQLVSGLMIFLFLSGSLWSMQKVIPLTVAFILPAVIFAFGMMRQHRLTFIFGAMTILAVCTWWVGKKTEMAARVSAAYVSQSQGAQVSVAVYPRALQTAEVLNTDNATHVVEQPSSNNVDTISANTTHPLPIAKQRELIEQQADAAEEQFLTKIRETKRPYGDTNIFLKYCSVSDVTVTEIRTQCYKKLMVDGTNRVALALAALHGIALKPLFGNGFGSFEFIALNRYDKTVEIYTYPHNFFLGIAYETGLFGVLVVAGSGLVALIFAVRNPDIPPVVKVSALSAIAFLFLSVQVAGDFYDTRMMWVLLSAMVAYRSGSDGEDPTSA